MTFVVAGSLRYCITDWCCGGTAVPYVASAEQSASLSRTFGRDWQRFKNKLDGIRYLASVAATEGEGQGS